MPGSHLSHGELSNFARPRPQIAADLCQLPAKRRRQFRVGRKTAAHPEGSGRAGPGLGEGHPLRGRHALCCGGTRHARGITLERAAVNLVHAGIGARKYPLAVRILAHRALRERLKVRHADDPEARSEGEPLGHACGQTHPGKPSGTATKDDGIEVTQPQPSFREERLYHRQDDLCRSAPKELLTLEPAAINKECHGTVLGRGIESEDFHEATAVTTRAPWRRRKRTASEDSRVTVICGSAARNTRP